MDLLEHPQSRCSVLSAAKHAWRGGGRSRRVTVLFGLAFATVLTLIVVPVLYAAFYRVPSLSPA